MKHTNFPSLCAFAAFATLPAAAQTVIQPTMEAASKDTKIYGSVPFGNFSSNLNLTSPDVGAYFLSLVQFDLASLGALTAGEITSATLTLYATGLGVTGGPAAGGSVTVSPILDAWLENAFDVGPEPLATYDAFLGPDPTLAFASAVASQNVTGAGFYSWDITDTVKSWVDGSLDNNGFFIQLATPGGDIGFADVDSAPGIVGSSPKLTVVPEPSTAALLGGTGLLAFIRCRSRR